MYLLKRSSAKGGPSGCQSRRETFAASGRVAASPARALGTGGPASNHVAMNALAASSSAGGFSSHARNTADAGAFVGVSTKSFESGQIFNRCAAASTGPSQYRRRSAAISAGSFSGATATAGAAAVDPDAIPREVRRAASV